jgi:hypothetical protein
MSLIECPDCSAKVSSLAVACPRYARPVASLKTGKSRGCGLWIRLRRYLDDATGDLCADQGGGEGDDVAVS